MTFSSSFPVVAIAVMGPTLEALDSHLGVPFPNMSFIFMGRSVGYLAGSILGGLLFESCSPYLLLGAVLLAGGVGLVAAPFAGHLGSLAAVISAVGLAMGALDTGETFCGLVSQLGRRPVSGSVIDQLVPSFRRSLGQSVVPSVRWLVCPPM